MLDNLDFSHLPREKAEQAFMIAEELKQREVRKQSREDFLTFVKAQWPSFIEGAHHRKMSQTFNRIARGELKRVIINMGPRHSKSEMSSYFLPAWLLGLKPDLKIIQATHTGELAVRFGRKIRDLVDTEDYIKVFPDVTLRADSKAAGRWETSKGGEYFAAGVGGAITGRGADVLIIDDPHSEQDAMSETAMDMAYEWYTSGPRQRLQPGGTIILVMTRWSKKDLTGQLLKAQALDPKADQWEVIELPAILPSGKPLWDAFWKLEELEALKAELPSSKWMAQYQQDPTSEEGALVKREWWRVWDGMNPPDCEFIIQSWDTAFLKTQRADYSACTTWGVFYKENDDGFVAPNLILLDAYKERLEFPDLKKMAFEKYNAYKPDAFIVEAKAAGLPLIFELRQTGIPVQEYTPSRGNDKISRVNAVSDLFASGIVWAPETRWAEEVVEEFAGFPNMEHDDLVDSSTQALLRFRQGGFVPLDSDEEDEPIEHNRKADYY